MTISQHGTSPRALSALIARLTGAFPNPDDAGPVGPWGPVIRKAGRQFRQVYGPQPDPWRWAALNPQPLPPRLVYAVALAQAVIDQVDALQDLALALPDEAQRGVQAHASGVIRRFIDDCGNGHIVIHLPRHVVWPPGDDEPRPISPEELVVIGARLAQAGAVHPDFEAAGQQLGELGQGRM